ncbi:hypothetical protein ACROYT_G026509 [Oculina patagonica]
MASPIIEGIDNEVLFVFSVFAAFVTIVLVHFVYESNRNRSTRQNESNSTSDSNSTRSTRSEDQPQEISRDEQDAEPENANPVTEEDFNQTTSPSHAEVAEENASEPVNNTSTPQMDRMSDGQHCTGPAENTPTSDGQSSPPRDHISIRVKFMEHQRVVSVNRTITVGDFKRLCFSDDLNHGRRVRLIFRGRLLQDDTLPISYYGIIHYSVVHAQISEPRRDRNEQSAMHDEEEDLDISKLFLPLLAIAFNGNVIASLVPNLEKHDFVAEFAERVGDSTL